MGVPVDRLNKMGEGSPHVVDWIERGDVDIVVNTPTARAPARRLGDPAGRRDPRRSLGETLSAVGLGRTRRSPRPARADSRPWRASGSSVGRPRGRAPSAAERSRGEKPPRPGTWPASSRAPGPGEAPKPLQMGQHRQAA